MTIFRSAESKRATEAGFRYSLAWSLTFLSDIDRAKTHGWSFYNDAADVVAALTATVISSVHSLINSSQLSGIRESVSASKFSSPGLYLMEKLKCERSATYL